MNCLWKQSNFLLVRAAGIKVYGCAATYSLSSKDSDFHAPPGFCTTFATFHLKLRYSSFYPSVLLVAENYRNPMLCSFTFKVVRKRFTVASLCKLVLRKALQCGTVLLARSSSSALPHHKVQIVCPVLSSYCRRSEHNLNHFKFELF